MYIVFQTNIFLQLSEFEGEGQSAAITSGEGRRGGEEGEESEEKLVKKVVELKVGLLHITHTQCTAFPSN